MSARHPIVGDVFASNDKRDIRSNHNQERIVVAVEAHAVKFSNPPWPTRWVARSSRGVKRHRFVRSGPESS